MAKFKAQTFTIRDAKFAFPPDFTGTVDEYNIHGDKTFDLLIPDEDMYLAMKEDGWNVKQWPKKPEPDQDVIYYLNVKVNYCGNKLDPVIWRINADNHNKRQLMTNENVHILDSYFDDDCITEMIVTVRPREYPPSHMRPEGGIKAYCKKLVVFYRPDDVDALLESLGAVEDDEETPFD